MAVLPIPKGVIKKVESLITNFLWDQGVSKRFHWIRQEKILRPKICGGLGIKGMKDTLLTNQGKMAWEFICQDSLWAKYARSRFYVWKEGSSLWNSINHLIDHLRINSKWDLGDGSMVIDDLCWHHNVPCSRLVKGKSVKEVVMDESMNQRFLQHVNEDMRSYYGEYYWKRGSARLVWTGHPSGVFSRRIFQETFETRYERPPWARVIWQVWLPQKISLFMWRLI